MTAAVPVFPLSNLEQHVDALRKTCHETGLFYLRLDDAEACERCAAAAINFFDSDEETKAACGYEASPAFRGYMRLGVENTAGVIDAREQIELGREDGICDGVAQRLVGANRWPDDGGALQSACEPWFASMSAAAARVTRALSLGLGLEASTLDDRVLGQAPHWQAKLASYPPDVGPGVGAHSDSGWLTLLWADQPGLEAQLRTGEWVAVPPRDGAVAVNLGEMLQLASGGYYRATPHRVGPSSQRRVSLPFFWNPSLSAIVDVVCDPSLLPWTRDRPEPEKRHSLLRAYGANAFKSLARSHPLVFARHHPDLCVLEDGTVAARDEGDAAAQRPDDQIYCQFSSFSSPTTPHV